MSSEIRYVVARAFPDQFKSCAIEVLDNEEEAATYIRSMRFPQQVRLFRNTREGGRLTMVEDITELHDFPEHEEPALHAWHTDSRTWEVCRSHTKGPYAEVSSTGPIFVWATSETRDEKRDAALEWIAMASSEGEGNPNTRG